MRRRISPLVMGVAVVAVAIFLVVLLSLYKHDKRDYDMPQEESILLSETKIGAFLSTPLQFNSDIMGQRLLSSGQTHFAEATKHSSPTGDKFRTVKPRVDTRTQQQTTTKDSKNVTGIVGPQLQPVAVTVTPLDETLLQKIYTIGQLERHGQEQVQPPAGLARVFDGTRVPRRVVVTYFPESMDDLIPQVRDAVMSWRTDGLVSDVEIVYYGDRAARAFLVEYFPQEVIEAWDALVPGAFKADLFRYCEILKNGGLYVDVKCTRSLSFADIIGREGTIAVDQLHSGAWNGVFAAPPGAPWVAASLVRALENIFSRKTEPSPCLDITGPGVLGRSVREWVGETPANTTCAFLRSHPELLETRGVRVLAMDLQNTQHIVTLTPRKRVVLLTTNAAYRKQQRRVQSPITEYAFACQIGQVYRSDAKASSIASVKPCVPIA